MKNWSQLGPIHNSYPILGPAKKMKKRAKIKKNPCQPSSCASRDTNLPPSLFTAFSLLFLALHPDKKEHRPNSSSSSTDAVQGRRKGKRETFYFWGVS